MRISICLFSPVQYSIDDSLPFIMNILLAQTFGLLGTIAVTSYGLPWFTVMLVPLGVLYYYIQRFYRRTSRSVATTTLFNLCYICTYTLPSALPQSTTFACTCSVKCTLSSVVILKLSHPPPLYQHLIGSSRGFPQSLCLQSTPTSLRHCLVYGPSVPSGRPVASWMTMRGN